MDGNIDFGGPIESPVTLKTIAFADSPYTIGPEDDVLRIDTTGGDVVLNLQKAELATSRGLLLDKLVDANNITLNAFSGETVLGLVSASTTILGTPVLALYPIDGVGWAKASSSDESASLQTRSVRTITTTPISQLNTDDVVEFEMSSIGGNAVYNLQEASASLARVINLVKVGAGSKIDVFPFSGETVNNNTKYTLTGDGESVTLYARDGVGWRVL